MIQNQTLAVRTVGSRSSCSKAYPSEFVFVKGAGGTKHSCGVLGRNLESLVHRTEVSAGCGGWGALSIGVLTHCARFHGASGILPDSQNSCGNILPSCYPLEPTSVFLFCGLERDNDLCFRVLLVYGAY